MRSVENSFQPDPQVDKVVTSSEYPDDRGNVLLDTVCEFKNMFAMLGLLIRNNIIKILVALFVIPGIILFAVSACVMWRLVVSFVASCYANLLNHPIGAGLIFVLAAITVSWMIHVAIKRKGNGLNVDADFGDDLPKDELHRDAFVLALTQRLCENGERCRYIGLYGKWGEGKTYVYRMMKAKTPEVANLEFVLFSPWDMPNGSISATSLFTAIAARMSADLESDFRKFATRVDASTSISWMEKIPWIGGALSWLYLAWRDPLRAKRKLSNVLRERRKNVIVVIDDLDRLPPAEIYEVLRLIKANGDLPFVTYLILADKRYLASALDVALSLNAEDNVCNGMTYLEKIVPVECDLPSVSVDDLMAIALHRIAQLTAKYPKVSFDWKHSDMSDISPLIRSIRDVNRFVDAFAWGIAFHFSKARYGKKEHLEVWIPDLVALTALRVFEKEIYLSLFDYHDVLLGSESSKINHEWVVENLVHSKDNLKVDVAKKFMVARMGFKYENDQTDVLTRRPPSKTEKRDYRINVLTYFKNYYCGFDSSLPGKNELTRFLNDLQDVNHAHASLLRFYKANQLSRIFSLIAERPTPLKKEMANNYLCVLAMMLDDVALDGNIKDVESRSYLSLGLPAHDAVEREIIRTLKRSCEPEGNDIANAVVMILKTNKAINFAARFMNLRHMDSRELSKITAFRTMFTDRNVAVALADRLMSEMRCDYDWDKNVDRFNLHRAWFYSVKEYGQEEDRTFYRNWAEAIMRKGYGYEFAAWPFVQLVPDKRGLVTINYDDISEYSDLKDLKWGLKKYGDDSLLYHMLAKLISFCEIRKVTGRYNFQEQMECLGDDPDFSAENIADAIDSGAYIS